MAVHFRFKTKVITAPGPTCGLEECLDKCSYNKDTMIGSWACTDCEGFKHRNISKNIISCTKIIYRHANGKVIMRKKK